MNTKSVPSLYRYCMSRLSTFAVSTFRPALNVRSTTFPDRTFFSLVRTNAPPLPGLTCWNSMTVHSWPSIFSTVPFFRSLVVATIRRFLSGSVCVLCSGARAGPQTADHRTRPHRAPRTRAAPPARPRGSGEQGACADADGGAPDQGRERADDEPLGGARVLAQ